MAKDGSKGQKIGRNKRAPSNAAQTMRSAKNKRLNIEREPLRQRAIAARKAKKRIVRGAKRALRRQHMARKVSAAA